MLASLGFEPNEGRSAELGQGAFHGVKTKKGSEGNKTKR
jgi:hypothetical protein